MNDTHPTAPQDGAFEERDGLRDGPRRIQLVPVALDKIRLDGGTQSRAAMDLEMVAEYADNYHQEIQMPPVVIFKDPQGALWLADGFHRWHAARRAGLERLPCQVHRGDRIDALRHSLGANAAHGLRRSNADKRRAVELALEHEVELAAKEGRATLSDSALGRMCRVDHKTVARHRANHPGNSQDGIRTVRRGLSTYTLDTLNLGPQSAGPPDRHPLFDKAVTFSGEYRPGLAPLERPAVEILHSSASNEWYTPAEYVDAARALMGGIDLDPASCELANETVKAERFFTKEDDGFEKPWSGRVWMNPPFGLEGGESNQGRWSSRLIERFEAGEVSEAVFLTNATTDRSWFKAFWKHALCFVDKRIAFFSPDGKKMQPTHGNVLVYLGDEVEGFIRLFGPFGQVVIPGGEGLSEVVA